MTNGSDADGGGAAVQCPLAFHPRLLKGNVLYTLNTYMFFFIESANLINSLYYPLLVYLPRNMAMTLHDNLSPQSTRHPHRRFVRHGRVRRVCQCVVYGNVERVRRVSLRQWMRF